MSGFLRGCGSFDLIVAGRDQQVKVTLWLWERPRKLPLDPRKASWRRTGPLVYTRDYPGPEQAALGLGKLLLELAAGVTPTKKPR